MSIQFRPFAFASLLLLASASVASSQSCFIQERDGLVVFEAEQLTLSDSWAADSTLDGASDSTYIVWTGPDYFTTPGNGVLEAKLLIQNPGTYRFNWRGKVGEGTSFTDFNDSWLKFPDAEDFYGQRVDGHRVYPHGSGKTPAPAGAGFDGWLKVYLTATTDWTWSTNTSDNDPHDIYVRFDKPSEYTLLVSARSRNHLIDRVVLSNGADNWSNLDIEPSPCIESGSSTTPSTVVLAGEAKRWHVQTLDFVGPMADELDETNPFMDYRLSVEFTNEATGNTFVVPGYFAACGTAADDSCTAGDTWRAHFTPSELGIWNWTASFVSGTDIAVSDDPGTSAGFFDGFSGAFFITESDKNTPDHRAPTRGRLAYVGEHYLKYTGTDPSSPNGKWFFKAGADAPENTLAYDGFDGTPNLGSRRKSWTPHAIDYDSTDAAGYNWSGDAGSNILGMLAYLSAQKMNAFSFLTFNVSGDDGNVFPHLLKVDESTYNGLAVADQWELGVHHDRFDVSKLAQWDRLFSFGDKKGLYLHFKLAEEENETKMDGGDLGRERKAYYRELVARFGHHLALNWNIGEENGPPVNPMTTQQRQSAIEFIASLDAYDNNVVLHTRPDKQSEVYTPLLGVGSSLTGASIQADISSIHLDVAVWVQRSAAAGRKWVVANDEQGPHQFGVGVDADYTGTLPSSNIRGDNRINVRSRVLWGTLMAGGAGVEYYYGYETGCVDLDCQDHRTRASKWADARIALDFFDDYLADHIPDLESAEAVTRSGTDYVLADVGSLYVVYMPTGKLTSITLPDGNWKVQWFNPREGGALSDSTIIETSITAPDTQDWVAVITPSASGVSNEPDLGAADPEISIEQNYPNPFGPRTTVAFALPASGVVSVDVYDLNGRLVSKPVDTQLYAAGTHTSQIDATGWASGTYIVTLTAGEKRVSKSMTLIR